MRGPASSTRPECCNPHRHPGSSARRGISKPHREGAAKAARKRLRSGLGAADVFTSKEIPTRAFLVGAKGVIPAQITRQPAS